MKSWKLFASAVVVTLFATAAMATVSINEIRIDDSGGDTDEYFELTGTPNESLTGLWYIVIGDFSSGTGNGGRSGRVEYTLDLTGESIQPDGFFLAASTALGTDVPLPDAVDLTTSLAFENSDNVTHMLVQTYTGATDGSEDIDTDKDGVPNGSLPWTSIQDSIALVETANPPTTTFNEWSYDFGTSHQGPDGSYVPAHVYRLPDGDPGGWHIGPFGTGGDTTSVFDTPGGTNLPEPSVALLLAAGAAFAMRRRR